MPPRLRPWALLIHIICSVGWIGALAGFLALTVAALHSQDATIVRSTYLAMQMLGCWVIVPLSLAALVSGSSRQPRPNGASSDTGGWPPSWH